MRSFTLTFILTLLATTIPACQQKPRDQAQSAAILRSQDEAKPIIQRSGWAVFQGPHQLRKMASYKSSEGSTNGSLNGGFFLFMGGISGSTKGSATTVIKVTFSWQLSDGTYAISTLPIERFRVRLDPKVEARTIVFEPNSTYSGTHFMPGTHTPLSNDWNCCAYYQCPDTWEPMSWCPSAGRLMDDLDQWVQSAVITVQPEDWPENIQLPLNQ